MSTDGKLSGIRAAGVHTYFGGFHRSLEADTEWLGSAESWSPAIRARRLAGLPTLNHPGLTPHAELVVSNPPCSRFSAMSTGTYSEDHKTKLGSFCELEDAVLFAERVRCRAFWWETGPLLWTKGRELVRAVHRHWAERWGGCTTVAVKLDVRWTGVPQRRPRCHVVHVAGDREVPCVAPSAWPLGQPALLWARDRVASQGWGSDPAGWDQVKPVGAYRKMTALAYYEMCMLISEFIATRPQLVGLQDHFTNAVLSGRPMICDEEDRFVSWQEYAALMCLPLEMVRPVAEEQGGWQALMMMSKGVCPAASRWVADCVVAPLMGLAPYEDDLELVARGAPKRVEVGGPGGDVGWLEAVAPDWPRRRSAYGEDHRKAIPLKDQSCPKRTWE